MNKRQKLVQEQFLNNEEAIIKRLKQVYNQSLKDITTKAKELQDQINALDQAMESIEDSKELARLKSMKQSKVYQKQYQDALKKQVSSILDNMQVEEFKTVSEYLNKCYEEGFLGTMYDLQGQGIPLCFPMDQEAMVRAVQLDSKIKEGYYQRLGEDVTVLKKKITAQVSRGISTGMSFQQVAQQLASYTNIGYNNAVRIARTEGHRIQVQGGMDACYKAKDMGADVVKQWDSTLDKRTRDSHQQVDGEIRELDEKFSNGLMFPGDPSGRPEEVINCRCALLQRARWALDKAELDTLKERAEFFGLDKTKNFDDFKEKYNSTTQYADFRFKTEPDAGNVSSERKTVLEALSETPKNVVNAMKNTIVTVGVNGASAYDYTNDILYVAKGAKKEEVHHEIGHLIDAKLLEQKEIEKLKEDIFKDTDISDIIIETMYKTNGDPVDVLLVKNDQLVSEYQGRLYVDNPTEAFDDDGNLMMDKLFEFMSEPYREYMENPERLKKEHELFYSLIERAVGK